MFLIVVLLVTAIGSTGNYDFDDVNINWTTPKNSTEWDHIVGNWSKTSPYPSSYAICHFYTTPTLGTGNPVILSAVVSILLISVSFISRVVKVFEGLDVSLVAKANSKLSRWSRLHLSNMHDHASRQTRRLSVFRTLVYWPLLMGFLLFRIGSDFIASLTMEVSFAMDTCLENCLLTSTGVVVDRQLCMGLRSAYCWFEIVWVKFATVDFWPGAACIPLANSLTYFLGVSSHWYGGIVRNIGNAILTVR